MKTAVIVGTINRYPAPDGWRHIHVDASRRGIFDAQAGTVVEVDVVADMRHLPFTATSIDRIQCWHALEHVNEQGGHDTLAEFRRVLRPGGVLDIIVPDLQHAASALLDGDLAQALGAIYGDQTRMVDAHLNAHLWGYTADTLHDLLAAHGFTCPAAHPDCKPGEVGYRAIREA